MDGIEAAQKSRLAPAKVNAVLVRGLNDDEVESFANLRATAASSCVSSNSCPSMPTATGRAISSSPPRKSRNAFTRAGPWCKFPTSAAKPRAITVSPMAPRRNRPHRSGHATVLRSLLAHPPHRRRKTSHLSFQQGRSRLALHAARRRLRRGLNRLHHLHRHGKRGRPPHQ